MSRAISLNELFNWQKQDRTKQYSLNVAEMLNNLNFAFLLGTFLVWYVFQND